MSMTMTQGFRWPGLKVYNPVQPYGFKINFLRDSFSESATGFFATMLKFILSPIFDIKIYQIKFLEEKLLRRHHGHTDSVEIILHRQPER